MSTKPKADSIELRGAIGTLVKWLEDYHELGVELLKFEHPADREQFYNKATSLLQDLLVKERLSELEQFRAEWHTMMRQEVHQDLNDRIASLQTKLHNTVEEEK